MCRGVGCDLCDLIQFNGVGGIVLRFGSSVVFKHIERMYGLRCLHGIARLDGTFARGEKMSRKPLPSLWMLVEGQSVRETCCN